MSDILKSHENESTDKKKIKESEIKKDGKQIEEPNLPIGPKIPNDPATPPRREDPKKPQEPQPNGDTVIPNNEKVPIVDEKEENGEEH
ncbi:MAG: hypothetical protein K2P93_09295 [Alphaproteobacteria bacterium]|nr:hypothetical protein [Alphaproteobacteria bacterium]